VELFRRQPGVRALNVRLANGVGCPPGREVSQWSLAFNDFCRQAVEQKAIVLKTAGTQRRNFVTLGDVVRALEFVAARQDRWPADGILNLGSGILLSIREAAEIVAARSSAVLGFRPELHVPTAGTSTDKAFHFCSDRLAGLGFVWTDDLEAEVDATLRLCAGVLPRT
jgi:UDP-glucose 4-epimerase